MIFLDGQRFPQVSIIPWNSAGFEIMNTRETVCRTPRPPRPDAVANLFEEDVSRRIPLKSLPANHHLPPWPPPTFVLTLPSPFSGPFKVAFMYSVTVRLCPSFQHCHHARLHPTHHPFAQPRLGFHYRFKAIHHRDVSILCHTV